MSANDRLNTIKGHLSGNFPQGMLAGEVAIVTGSGQGIGKSCAEVFAREGALVVVTDIDAAKSDQVAADIRAAGLKAISIPGDILDPTFPERLIEETVKAFGKINHIVNNAGFTYDGMLHKITDKQWDLMLAVHNTAPFKIIRAAAKYLRKKDGENKSIVNVSSTSGLHGNVGQANYATAKAGIVGLTKTIAKEWGAFGVRCNTVAFGWVDTRLTRAKESGASIEVDGQKVALGIPTGSKAAAAAAKVNPYADIPLGRAGTADEVAGSVLTLCTPLTSYITGHTLEVTGGRGI
ncbi:3-oxoacyl-[acyl-carrier-protein] reductase FabG [Choanephora cucurbitarum]|uniref:3-oxoacyl-[acyl-carrier-protein] reductase n=1 Tax=Choanephora cucurbitarum TaxID=101091 RepID=A0A1C7NJW7_9FUNG|nr:3-oxoacyl-[acyl-carrier-protein] reductase FabG [Choanephora cucurbitarum]